MNPSSRKGNNPEKWDKLLNDLDEKLQFGLLEPLRRVHSYHLEANTLIIEPFSDADFTYFSKDAVKQQLSLLSSQSTGASEIILKKKED